MCLIDTGSTFNIKLFNTLQNIVENPILKKTEIHVKFYNGATMKSIGKYSLYTKKLRTNFLKLCFEIVLAKVSQNLLLSANTSKKLSLISTNNEVNAIGNSTSVETLFKKYTDVFEE